MAYVALSRTLLGEVNNNIKSMKTKELDSMEEDPILAYVRDQAGKPLELWLEEALWEGQLHLKSVLPASWIVKTEELRLNIEVDGSTSSAKLLAQHGTKIEIPPIHAGNYYQTIKIKLDKSKEYTQPLFLAVIAYQTKRKEIVNRWESVTSAVSDFLNKCKSLNQAIKLWPGISLYIPQEYIDKVNEKIERKNKDVEATDSLKSIDTDAIEAAAVIARLSTQT
jgi:hypothetical protein